ncbi:oligosaccharide flippase family protein [Colwellia sp. MB02u-6]|uniref:oligosaccharide flippase family protein n=1 Tax=Colwellia sp. MB02u-6 TaxID=2759824 RepID=UPI0015F72151|nr:oligosaccharide flippase family protein [Colwellia sp. MB02u-6]MBA6326359.1 oligosaccharide flippase family protein [Colwellia sp. MB02u-6]
MAIIKIIEKFGVLSLFQVFNLLIPFIVYPYLIRTYGADIYGDYVFAMVIATLLQVLVNFGFDLGGTKKVSETERNSLQISILFCIISSIKIIFFIVIMTLILLVFFFIDDVSLLVLVCFLYLVLESLFPVFIFNGIEEQKKIVIIQLPCRFIYLLLVFSFIEKDSAILLLVLFQILASMFALFISYLYLKYKINLKFVKFEFENLIFLIKETSVYFFSRIAGVLNVKVGALTVGSLFTPNVLAMFDLAIKIVELFRMPISIINQIIYPRIIKTKDFSLIKTCLLVFSGYSIISFLIIKNFGDYFILYLGGEDMKGAFDILTYIAILVPLSSISWILGNNALIAFGFKKEFFKSVIYSTVFLVCYMSYLIIISEDADIYSVLNGIILAACIVFYFRVYFTVKKHY